jgi:hypothetical protein
MPRWSFTLAVPVACAILLAVPAGPFSIQDAAAADGAWKERTQLVWSKGTRTLIRRNFRVWDPHPQLDLDFLWEPRSPTNPDQSETVASGPGTLTWYAKGAASYDRQFTYSVFKGVLSDGRPSGQGALVVRTGLSYTGQWLDGDMHGRGVLRFENGDRYEGDFLAGKMNGVGKYTSTDGSVFVGEFRDGARHGIGKLTLADGEYRTVWRDGQEIDRRQIPDSAPVRSAAALRQAAVSDTVKLKLSIDDKKSIEFENADPDAQSSTYEAEHAPGSMTIRLASKRVLDAWKGNGRIASGEEDGVPYILSTSPPVFLKAIVENQGTNAAQITGAFLDVSESATELAPYLELHPGSTKCCGPPDDYNPVLDFQNFGWGRVRDARMTYSLGPKINRTDETVVQLGTFETSKQVSIVGRLKQLDVDVERLRKASGVFWMASRGEGVNPNAFGCENGPAEAPNAEDKNVQAGDADAQYERERAMLEKEHEACFESIRNSGVLGKLKDLVFRQKDDSILYTIITGRIEYKWNDSTGRSNDRISNFTTNIPLLRFAPANAEMGFEEPIERQVKSTALSLDRRRYQVPLPKTWNAKLTGSEAVQFDFALSAAKSSQHAFQIVLQLADGNEVKSPMVALSYFRPRIAKKER